MLKILFVDDDQEYRELLAESLAAALPIGIEIQTHFAGNGREALSSLSRESFDWVVTDTNMPIMHGVIFLKEAKKLYPGVPICILFSGLEGSTLTTADIKTLGPDLILEKTNVLAVLPHFITQKALETKQ